MKRTLLASAALGFLLSTAAVPPAHAQSQPSPYRIWRGDPKLATSGHTVDDLIATFMAEHGIPGMTLAIVQAPYIPRSSGYGSASTTHDELASTKTMWAIGPITQAFTAVAVLQLKEAGQLDLSAPIGRYVAGLPSAWQDVSLLELLQHSSGIPDFRAVPSYRSDQAYRPDELIGLARSQQPLFPHGAQVRLSATNFILLGLAIEKASGMSYEDYVTRYQIEPLALASTMFQPQFAEKSRADRPAPTPGQNQHVAFKSQIPFINPVEPATGYQAKDGALQAVDAAQTAGLWAFGGIWSSAEDISKWDIGLAGSTLVKEAADRDVIYTAAKLAKGKTVPAMAGWEFTQHGFMEIKGEAPGFSAYLSRFTAADELVCVTLLSNREGVDLTDLARDIADAYMAGLGSGADAEKLVVQESKFPVDETVERIKAGLQAQNIEIFGQFDHGGNARKAGLSLRPTKVIVFGDAKAGTPLMAERPLSAIDLPLKLEVWQDERNRVWVGYRNMKDFGAAYGLKDTAALSAMNAKIDKVVAGAVNVYAY